MYIEITEALVENAYDIEIWLDCEGRKYAPEITEQTKTRDEIIHILSNIL